ncbi:MAG: aminotransferase class V-fold PLP-dependent enzyme [Gammaproteobacteria bacterium]|nr:aminotransferase class V-fold PLP-dependent enzyme [Gammaproteobacteria bacterium]
MSAPKFIGLDTQYQTADGKLHKRVHLDGAASPLASAKALQTIQQLLPHYSSSHTNVHSAAHICTQALAWAHSTVLSCLGADPQTYTSIFTGSGTTAGINRVARGLAAARPERKVVLVSGMEHHANDLPHRQFGNQVEYIPLVGEDVHQGPIDVEECRALLERFSGQVNYLAFSAVSNVTGILNPITELTRLAHQHGAYVLVDGAQAVPHLRSQLSRDDATCEVDFFCFSGHKLYTPTSPGVLIAKQEVLENLSGQDLGGGSVEAVSFYDYQLLSHYPDKEQSGTPNIVGAVALAAVFQEFVDYGFDLIEQHDKELMQEMVDAMSTLPHIIIYGCTKSPRIGALAFNHELIDHGLLAAVLNDYYGIAVRNECFCAHPYVSSMMKQTLWQLDLSTVPESEQQAYINLKRGMVRASLSLYNTSADVEALIAALSDINGRIDSLRRHYDALPDGSYQHRDFAMDWRDYLSV